MKKFKNIIIAAVIVIVAVAAFYGIAIYKNQRPVNLVVGAEKGKPDTTARLDTAKTGVVEGVDPCGGTGGTGQIISLGNHTITIKRRDGVNEIIKIAKQTMIKNSAGSLSESDLKTGYRVTVVVGLIVRDSRIASAILVCNATN